MNKYLADTTVVIEHLRGNEQATIFLESNYPHISTVTVAELIQGSKDKQDQKMVLKTCSSLTEDIINGSIAEKAINLMSRFYLSNGLQFLDAIVAATALHNKLILVTDNIKHFKFIPELKVLSHSEVFRE